MPSANRQIIFKAIGYDSKGQYDCSFSITFPPDKVTPQEIQEAVGKAVEQFREYHPTGRIVGNMERIIQ